MDKIAFEITLGTETEILQWALSHEYTKAYSIYSYRPVKITTLLKRVDLDDKRIWYACETESTNILPEIIAHNGSTWNDNSMASEVYRFRKDE